MWSSGTMAPTKASVPRTMGARYTWCGAGTSSTRARLPHHRLLPVRRRLAMPIRYVTEDTRSEEQVSADDRVREEIERTGGVWAQMSDEQRALIRARLHDKKQRAQAARARKLAEQKTLEERVAQLEERLA